MRRACAARALTARRCLTVRVPAASAAAFWAEATALLADIDDGAMWLAEGRRGAVLLCFERRSAAVVLHGQLRWAVPRRGVAGVTVGLGRKRTWVKTQI